MIHRFMRSWQRWAPWACALATAIVGILAWPYTVDDAYIVARYATNIARGVGYAFNPGEPSDGVTGPLWLVPSVAAVALGVDPVATQKALGLLFMASAVAMVVRRLCVRQDGRTAVPVACALLALHPAFGSWGIAGLETGLATWLLCGAALAATRRPTPAPRVVGLCVGLLAWLRPELALACLVIGLVLARRGRSYAVSALLVAAPWLIGVLAFRYFTFGTWLPLALSAKPGALSAGASYSVHAVLVSTGVLGAWLATMGALRARTDDAMLGLVCAAHVVAVCLSGGDWMPGFRLLVPVLPLYVFLTAVGAARVVRTRGGAWLAGAAVTFACLVTTLDLVTRMPAMRRAGDERERVGRALAERLARDATRVALVDVGFLGYASGLHVIDLGGVTSAEVAAMHGGHLDKRIPAAWLHAKAPDAVVLHSARPVLIDDDERVHGLQAYPVETRVSRMAWLHDELTPSAVFDYAPGYHYVLWLRRDAL